MSTHPDPRCVKCDRRPDSIEVDNCLDPDRRASVLHPGGTFASAGQTMTVRCHGETFTRHFTNAELTAGAAFPTEFFATAADACVKDPRHRRDFGGGSVGEFVAEAVRETPAEIRPAPSLDDLPPFKPSVRLIGGDVAGSTARLSAPHVATLPDGTTVALPAGTVLREGEGGGEMIDAINVAAVALARAASLASESDERVAQLLAPALAVVSRLASGELPRR